MYLVFVAKNELERIASSLHSKVRNSFDDDEVSRKVTQAQPQSLFESSFMRGVKRSATQIIIYGSFTIFV